MIAAELLGIHAPNRKLTDIPGGADSFWRQAQLGQVKWVKLLWPDHCRADAANAKARGYKVVIRIKGEDICFFSDVMAALQEFAGVADVFEFGNEPDAGDLWQHCYHIRYNVANALPWLHKAKIMASSPGWTGNAPAPQKPDDDRYWERWPEGDPRRLAACIIQSYAGLDLIGFHAYGEHVLEQGQATRIMEWAALWPDKELLGTEIGIAARILVPNNGSKEVYAMSAKLKGQRYGAFARLLAEQVPQVKAVVPFLADGATDEFVAFTDAGKANENGIRSYVIGDGGWAAMAAAAG